MFNFSNFVLKMFLFIIFQKDVDSVHLLTLTKEPLQKPVDAWKTGPMYNKEAIIDNLLNSNFQK